MAGQDQRVASIYADIKYRFGQKTVNELKQFKQNLVGMKKGLSEVKRTNPFEKTIKGTKKANEIQRKRIKLLRAELMIKRQLPKVAPRERGSIVASMNAATEGFKGGKLTGPQFDERVVKIKDRLYHATKRQAAAERDAARAARKYAREQRMAAQALFGFTGRLGAGVKMLQKQKMEAASLSHQFKKLRSNVIAFTGAYTAFSALANVNQVGQDFERVGFLMEAVLGQRAPEAMQFLRQESRRLGVDLLSTSKAFAKYTASAAPLGFTLDQMKSQFSGLSEAAVVFGLSADQQFGVIRALEQMASKGQVMAEELKLQLGDRLPGVLSIAAKSIGVTNKEFIKMMENGEIASKEFIPLFIESMRAMAEPGLARALTSTDRAQAKMVNSLTEWKEALFSGGLDQIFEDIFYLIRDILDATRPWISLLAGFLAGVLEPIFFIVRLIAAAFGDLTTILDWLSRKFLDIGLDELFSKVGFVLGQILAFLRGGAIITFIGWIVKGAGKLLGFFGLFGAIFRNIVNFFKVIQNSPIFKMVQSLFGKSNKMVMEGGASAAKDVSRGMELGMKAGVVTNLVGNMGIEDVARTAWNHTPVKMLIDFTGKAHGMLKEASTTQITRPVQSNVKG